MLEVLHVRMLVALYTGYWIDSMDAQVSISHFSR